MKTIEFPIQLDRAQQAQVSEWLNTIKHVWNRGLALLEWYQFYKRFEKIREIDPTYDSPVLINVGKVGNDWAYYCDRTVKARIDKAKSWDDANVEQRPACHLAKPHWREPPLITGFNAISLRKPFARKRYDKLGDVPQVLVNDYIGLVLAKAWADYLDTKRPEVKRPRYKGKRDRVDTMPSESFRASCTLFFATDEITLPGLGKVCAPGLSARLETVIERQQAHMLAHPECYPELAKKLEEREAFLSVARWIERQQDMPEELTPDLKLAYKKATQVIEKTGDTNLAIAKLRELAGKRELNTAIADLCTPGAFKILRRGERFFLQISVRAVATAGNPRPEPVGLDLGFNLLADTTNGVRIEHPDLAQLTLKINQLKQKQSAMKLGSKNWHRIQAKISKLEHHKTRKKRSHHHYYAGWLVDTNQNIAIKKFDPKSAVGRPLPRPKEDGEGYEFNGREHQREINAAVREIALGQFVGLIQEKAKQRGGDRVVELVSCDPAATPTEVLGVSSFTPDIEPAIELEGLVSPAHTPRQFKRKRRHPQWERKTV